MSPFAFEIYRIAHETNRLSIRFLVREIIIIAIICVKKPKNYFISHYFLWRPGGFEIRRRKRFDLLKRGICNPPIKGKACSFAADCKFTEPK